jgi:BirA family biotin operon repressor/biotin-[acetyl-CoA-carboxylase] ligase
MSGPTDLPEALGQPDTNGMGQPDTNPMGQPNPNIMGQPNTNGMGQPNPNPMGQPNPITIARLSSTACEIQVVEETGSTNADLVARIPRLHHPTLLVARHQTAGRGRAGRSWLSSADGGSLTFSLAWRFSVPLARLAGLPLAVGVALAESLGQLDVPVQLKWPNDLLKDGAKLGGILVESRQAGDATWAVIGVGLNLMLPDETEARIGTPAASAPWLARMDRNRLLATLLDRLWDNLILFEQQGLAPFMARWMRLHAYQGLPVRILDKGQTVSEGTAAGIDEHGRLLLDTGAGRIGVLAGDVSLRPVENKRAAAG